jgi:hypothetical protein
MQSPLLLAILVLGLSAKAEKPLVGAIYFGDWHVNEQHQEIHGTNWTEWEIPINAKPRYPGHLQPNIPLEADGFGMNAPEDQPANMAIKIDAAVANGIDLFLVSPFITLLRVVLWGL